MKVLLAVILIASGCEYIPLVRSPERPPPERQEYSIPEGSPEYRHGNWPEFRPVEIPDPGEVRAVQFVRIITDRLGPTDDVYGLVESGQAWCTSIEQSDVEQVRELFDNVRVDSDTLFFIQTSIRAFCPDSFDVSILTEYEVSVDEVWYKLADCETGNWIRTSSGIIFAQASARWEWGNPNIDLPPWGTKSFHGGLQFHPGTWNAYAPKASVQHRYAWQASIEEQIRVGKLVQQAQGWNAWPTCSRILNLL
jgi:hypothetical protein